MSRSLITEERKSSALLANCQPNEGIHARADITHGSADRLCHSRPVVTFDAQRLAADLGEARLLDRRDLSRRRALNTDADRRDRSRSTPHQRLTRVTGMGARHSPSQGISSAHVGRKYPTHLAMPTLLDCVGALSIDCGVLEAYAVRSPISVYGVAATSFRWRVRPWRKCHEVTILSMTMG